MFIGIVCTILAAVLAWSLRRPLWRAFKAVRRQAFWILGDIKVFPFPFFLIYDPSSFRIKGSDTRRALELLRPGDVIHRRYVHYLDGYFIPGKYSHSGVYVGNGKVVHAIAEDVEEIDVIDFLRCDGFCIMRPKDQTASWPAIERARKLIGSHYDFDFEDGNDAYYCHELAEVCYHGLAVEKKETRILGVRLAPRYLAESFMESPDFERVLEIC